MQDCKLFLFILMFSGLTLFGCATENKKDPTEPPPRLSESEYKKVVENYSRKDEQYSGFQNTYFVVATLMSAELTAEQMDLMRFYYQWNQATFSSKREKQIQKMSSATEVFLSFYSPERDHNDLQRPSSIWKIYLEVDGQRYEGKVEKLKDKFIDVVTLFPFHPRWSTAYRVTFPVPTSATERGQVKFTVTSSLGQTQFLF